MRIIDTGGELQGRKMALKFFKKVNTAIKDLYQTQENVEQVLKPILASRVADGVLIKDISLNSTSFTEVSHKLGRKPAGYIVVRKSAAQTVFEKSGDYNNRKLFLQLKSSGAVTVNLWIF